MRSIITWIASINGQAVDADHPLLTARITNDQHVVIARVAAALPPCSVTGPMIDIRLFPRLRPLSELLARAMVTVDLHHAVDFGEDGGPSRVDHDVRTLRVVEQVENRRELGPQAREGLRLDGGHQTAAPWVGWTGADFARSASHWMNPRSFANNSAALLTI